MTANQKMVVMVAREVMSENIGGSINGISDYEKNSDEYKDCLNYLAQPEEVLIKDLVNETFKECTNRFGRNLKFVGSQWLSEYIKKDIAQDNLEQYRN